MEHDYKGIRRTVITVVLFGLLLAYWIWPFVSLQRLTLSVAARDEAAMSDQIDFYRLRRSIVPQVIAAYSRIIGQKSTSTIFALAGPDLIEIALLQILTPENLARLLEGNTISTELGPVSFDLGDLPGLSLSSIATWWLGTEYWLDTFSIGLPVGAPTAEQYRLQLQLKQWRWKVVGIDLPERLLTPIAQELAKKYP
jgi:hypothetical protein